MVSYKNIEKFALVSVYDKFNINKLCSNLKKFNIGIISTGSTYKKIKSLGFECYEVSSLTDFEEILDGRVKTLHHKIYSSILFDRNKKSHIKTFKEIKFPTIDFVIVNLYPFEKVSKKTKEEEKIIEMIDIGGSALIRSSSKNYNSVTSIGSPKDYESFFRELKDNDGSTSLRFRRKMATKSFEISYNYDKQIFEWLQNKKEEKIILRYGENPNQKSNFLLKNKKSFFDYQIQGKKISYNNILDINSGLDILNEFKEPTTVIIKHNNPCGVASGKNIQESFNKAIRSDKDSSFGGVVLFNRKIKSEESKLITNSFFEIIIAPDFTNDSLKILKNKKKLILINSSKILKKEKSTTRSIRGGYLNQTIDNKPINKKSFKTVSRKNKISKKEFSDILFAFKVVKHIKSNAIVLVKNKQTVGIGAGQMNRFDATRLALMKYKDNFKLRNFVCASDAFFPFTDSLELLFKNKCSCVVQPSGSINDEKIINFANKKNIKLLFSKNRVFKH